MNTLRRLTQGSLLLAAALAAACGGHSRPSTEPESPPPSLGADANRNGITDREEIASGFTPDVNGNAVPDDAESWAQLPYGCSSAVVFGDSLSDTGNMYRLYGVPPSPPNYAGRYSNGPVWVEYLTSFLGLPNSLVQNYAHGGATTGHGNVSIAGAPGLLDQVQFYADHVAANGTPDANTLFVVWIGPNDFAAATGLGSTVAAAMVNIEHALTGLHALGAQHFLVLNAPDLARTPHVHEQADAGLTERARIATIAFNANLAWTLGELERTLPIDIVHQDFFMEFERIAADPSQFGFSDATSRCLLSDADAPCPDAAQRVFWDGLHPTTAGHRRIALQSAADLLSGGAPLPQPGLGVAAGMVEIHDPVHGLFAGQDVVTVTGTALAAAGIDTTLMVNGIPVTPSANGHFSVDVALEPGRLQNPIVAALSAGSVVLDRDRVVVFRGTPLAAGEAVSDAVTATLTQGGIDDLRDLVSHQLFASGALDVAGHLAGANPLAANFTGTFQYVVDATNAGFAWSTLELEPLGDRIRLRVNLHDVFVDWHVHAWLQGLPDPGFDCWGRVAAGMFSVFADLQFSPGAQPGEIDVTQVSPLAFEMTGFAEWHDCDFIVDLASFFHGLQFNIQQRLQSGIGAALDGATQQQVLPQLLEAALARISVSRAVGGAVGAPIDGHVNSIATAPGGVAVSGYLAVGDPSTTQRTLRIPHGPTQHTALDPSGQPYDFAVSVALSTLNQALLTMAALQPTSVTELDLGDGELPLTAATLATLIPALHALEPQTLIALRLRPTLPPMLLGQPTGPAIGSLGGLSVAQVLVEAVAVGSSQETPLVTLSLDLEARLQLGFDPAAGALAFTMQHQDATATLLDNPLGVPEGSLVQLVEAIAPRLLASAGTMRLALPEVAGMQLAASQAFTENGVASLYFRTSSQHARADLVVTAMNVPAAVDRFTGFDAQVTITNSGAQSVPGGDVPLVLYLSLDGALDPFDPQVAAVPVSVGGLAPGATVQRTVSVPPMPWAAEANQTLFAVVDSPAVPGGAGAAWERNERNNHASVSLLTTSTDAYAVWVQSPSDLVGGVGPRTYRVRVGRNNVGPTIMQVPVTVAIGSPTITWQTLLVDVPSGQEIEFDIDVLTPAVFGPGGQIVQFSVLACCNLFADSNRNNDCASTTAGIAAPFWDVAFGISGPGATAACSTLGWTVTVQNVGNVWSPSVCAFTALSASPNPGEWIANTLPLVHFWVPPLAPGQSWTFPVANYQVCNLWIQTQYLKVEINYTAGCFDLYNGTGNNFAFWPIQIY